MMNVYARGLHEACLHQMLAGPLLLKLMVASLENGNWNEKVISETSPLCSVKYMHLVRFLQKPNKMHTADGVRQEVPHTESGIFQSKTTCADTGALFTHGRSTKVKK